MHCAQLYNSDSQINSLHSFITVINNSDIQSNSLHKQWLTNQ